MKKYFILVLFIALASLSNSQDTIQYPYPNYMEWPRSNEMYPMIDINTGEYHAVDVSITRMYYPTTREFVVDTPTTIYGIAGMLWRQNEYRTNLRVMLFSAKNSFRNIKLLKTVRWTDSLPMRYVRFDAQWCNVIDSNIYHDLDEKYVDFVPTYEFYFDTPVVATDTILVGYQSLGDDGEVHYNDSANILYIAGQQICCDRSFRKPIWRELIPVTDTNLHVEDSFYYSYPTVYGWGAVLPIITAPCVYDTLTCANVRDFDVRVREDGEVELLWYADEVHPRYQVSVGPEGSDPDTCVIYEVEGSPYVIPGVWDTAVRYEVHIRALCEKECGGEDTTVWSEWSWPVYFGVQLGRPSGVEETGGEVRFVLSPNPARGTVAVTLAEPTGKAVELTVRDASGRKVRSMTFAGQSAMVDISGLAAGSYIVTLVTADGEATSRRLVVE